MSKFFEKTTTYRLPTSELPVQSKQWENCKCGCGGYKIEYEVARHLYLCFFAGSQDCNISISLELRFKGVGIGISCKRKFAEQHWLFGYVSPKLLYCIARAIYIYRIRLYENEQKLGPLMFKEPSSMQRSFSELYAGDVSLGYIMPSHMWCQEWGNEIIQIVHEAVCGFEEQESERIKTCLEAS